MYHPDTLTNVYIKNFQTPKSLATHVEHLSSSTTSPLRRFWLVLWGRSTMGHQNGRHFQTWKVRLLHDPETPGQWSLLIYIRSWLLLFTFCAMDDKTAVAITRSRKTRRWTRQRRHDVCTCLTSRSRSMTSFKKKIFTRAEWLISFANIDINFEWFIDL